MSRIITCPDCRQEKPHKARGKCARCYARSLYPSLPAADPCACGRRRSPGRDECLDCILRRLGISYRQCDYWSRHGWLKPAANGRGSGSVRDWPDSELEVAGRMGRLVSAGLPVAKAAAFARGSWPRAEIAPGVVLEVTG